MTVLLTVLIVILVAVVQERSRHLAAIIATMPLTAPLAMWIVFSASSGNQRQTADFVGSMVIGSVASLGFVLACWVGLRQEWGFPITLMSYGTDRRDLYRRSATYVHRILTGASPADLPVERPVKFELAINLKTARLLGLTIPPALLRRADYTVQWWSRPARTMAERFRSTTTATWGRPGSTHSARIWCGVWMAP